jgi:hypothetical protein
VFVNLINPVTHQGYRVQFTMDEIKWLEPANHSLWRTRGTRSPT